MSENKNTWQGKSFSFFQNKKCEYFPCHKTDDYNNFNCLFCFCPLYYFEKCIGDYKYTKDGIRKCADCTIPHLKENYGLIIDCINENNKKRSEEHEFV